MEIFRKHLVASDLPYLRQLLTTTKASVAAFDTEADGLDIIESRPFLFQFGFINDHDELYAFAVDLEETTNWREFINVVS